MKNLNCIKRPSRPLSLMLLLIFTASCVHHPKLPTAEEAKTEVMTKITKAAEEWSKGNTMGYYNYAAEDIIWMDEMAAEKPVQGKAQLKTYLETFKGQIPEHQYKLIDPVFQVYSDVVTANYRYQGTFEGEPQTPWKVTAVFRYIDGDWWSVQENWTEVKSTGQTETE